MTDAAPPSGDGPALVAVGVSHRGAAPALRDALFVPETELDSFHAALRRAGIAQAIVLSTCDRTEIHAAHDDPAFAAEAIARVLTARAGDAPDAASAIERRAGVDALARIFAIASSLESHVAGEPQVLGQVKEAHRRAAALGLVGPVLEAVLQAAYAAAKRVRNETTIGERPVSLASAAVALARDVHGDLGGAAALLIGTGELGELMVTQLGGAGLRRVTVVDPHPSRAAAQAGRLGAHHADFARLPALLADCDVLVTAAATGRVLVDREAMADALARRRRRPVLVLDLAVPADVDPGVDAVDGVFRYSFDDLERVALEGRTGRESELARARAIVAEEVARFLARRSARAATPAIAALRQRFEAERERALADSGGDAARATELMMNRLLHAPSAALRDLAEGGADPAERARAEELLRRLFGIDPGSGR